MEQILLRRAKLKDAPGVLAVTKAAFDLYAKEVRKRESIAALYETIEDVKSDIQNKYVYVCELDGEIAGSVRLTILESGIAYLSRFSISPDAQNLGLGGLLMEKVREECIKMGVRAIALHTASKMRSTVSFYLKNGYYIHSISKDADYIRAFMVNELTEMDEMFDYESVVGKIGKSHTNT
jgi:predicted N-acetyltransferase YhbS